MNAPAKSVRRRTFAKGEAVFVQGDPSDHAYFVQKGSVLLSRRSDQGTIPLLIVKEKQVFGEMALLDEERRTMTASAREETTVIVIMKQEFKTKLEDSDPLVRVLLRVLARNLGDSAPPSVTSPDKAPWAE
jgi:CRP-like cAMP-binding protein